MSRLQNKQTNKYSHQQTLGICVVITESHNGIRKYAIKGGQTLCVNITKPLLLGHSFQMGPPKKGRGEEEKKL